MEREIQNKKEELYNSGYQAGLVGTMEREEEREMKRGVGEGWGMEVQGAREHGRVKAAEMLSHLK